MASEAQRFEIGIGVDVPYPLHEAYALLTPTLSRPREVGPDVAQAHGWLLHVDSRNVVATDWTPHVVTGCIVGFRVRLLETSGRSVHTRLAHSAR